MLTHKLSTKLRKGVELFVEFCLKNIKGMYAIMCLCVKYENLQKINISKMSELLFFNGIGKSYK